MSNILFLSLFYEFSIIFVVMILDVARHKFSEGILILALSALVAMVFAFMHPVEPVVEYVIRDNIAPFCQYIEDFANAHFVLSSLLVPLLFVWAVLRLSRATVRFPLYPSATMAAIALCSLSFVAILPSQSVLYAVVVILVAAEGVARLLGCFGPNIRPSRLFSSMLAFGLLPLLDSSLVVVAIFVPLLLIVVRQTLREAVIAIIGVSVPSFVYCYVVWCFGGSFLEAFANLYADVFTGSIAPLVVYLTLPRLIMLGVLLFMQLSSTVFYLSTRMSLAIGARSVWTILHIALLLFVVSFVLLPSTSVASILVVVVFALPMLPLYFLNTTTLLSVLSFFVLFVASFTTLFIG